MDKSNRAYVLTHGDRGIEWSNYRHPLRERVYEVSAKPLGGFSIALGIVALVGTSLISYERGVAEIILAAAIALWFVVFSIRMLRRTSLSET
jgi:hypothetical protein